MKLYSLEVIGHLKRNHGFTFSKSLGQNFIIDRHPLEAMVDASDMNGEDLVIEIGPGIGALTAEAASVAKHVTAIEIDERLRPILAETLGEYENIDIVFEDILKVDLVRIIEDRRKEYDIQGETRIIGNLPYYITTPIIMKLLEDDVDAASISIMTQKEVADRMEAGPGGKEYGALSIMLQYRCKVEKVAKVPKGCFYPVPKVDSAIVKFTMPGEEHDPVEDEKAFFDCVRAGFGQRRKTLLNALSAGLRRPKDEIKTVLEAAGVDPGRRAETLSIDEFIHISNQIIRG